MAENNEKTNPLLDEITKNLDSFIENIKCLRETYGYSEGSLNQQLAHATKAYDDLVKPYIIKGGENAGELEIPSDRLREYKKLDRKKKRAERAQTLIPPSYIVTLVSLFDSFYAGLIRCIYNLCPEKLKACKKEILFENICDFDYITEVRKYLVDSIIEDLLRKSHNDQFEWLAKSLGVSTLKDFEGWAEFIELTERRNLFVHSDGVVSSQYLSVCKEHKAQVKNVQFGSKLNADKKYFCDSFKLVYKMSIMLTQVLINKLYISRNNGKDEDRDRVLINNVYELILEKHYDVAIAVSKFVLDDHFHRNSKDKCYIILNLAQAYKWSGDDASCKEVLSKEDTTMWKDDLLVPMLCLKEDFDAAYPLIEQVGSNSTILTPDAYRNWPIFNGLRERDDFIDLFKKVFGEDLRNTHNINVAEAVKSQDETATTSASE